MRMALLAASFIFASHLAYSSVTSLPVNTSVREGEDVTIVLRLSQAPTNLSALAGEFTFDSGLLSKPRITARSSSIYGFKAVGCELASGRFRFSVFDNPMRSMGVWSTVSAQNPYDLLDITFHAKEVNPTNGIVTNVTFNNASASDDSGNALQNVNLQNFAITIGNAQAKTWQEYR